MENERALTLTEAALRPTSASLVAEQSRTLAQPRRRYSLLARMLFLTMDVLYGRRRSFKKFKVLEVVARVPYQAWENVAYVAMTHTHRSPAFARRIFQFVVDSRKQQDNEQWHLFILEELLAERGERQGFLRFFLIPQLLSMVYYHISWLLFVVSPSMSHRLNADFEDHAEHEYMEFVRENPSFTELPWQSAFKSDYGNHATLADVLMQIALDERHHKEESLSHLTKPRFT